jgi:hypothetical protein
VELLECDTSSLRRLHVRRAGSRDLERGDPGLGFFVCLAPPPWGGLRPAPPPLPLPRPGVPRSWPRSRQNIRRKPNMAAASLHYIYLLSRLILSPWPTARRHLQRNSELKQIISEANHFWSKSFLKQIISQANHFENLRNPTVKGRRTKDAGQRTPVKGRQTKDAGQRSPDKGRRTKVAGHRSPDIGRRTKLKQFQYGAQRKFWKVSLG